MCATKPYHWLCLAGAILLEVAGTTVMKLSQGWQFVHAAALGLGCMWGAVALSYYLLAKAVTGINSNHIHTKTNNIFFGIPIPPI